jgi:hypothetical protein
MTDGENTVSMLSDGTHDGSTRADADAATAAICANAKAQKIEIFTIAFMVTDTAAKSMLQKCASDSAHYFDASDASNFQIAFAKIAYALRTPYIAS